MLAMHRDGRIELPPPKWHQNRPAPITFGPDTEPPSCRRPQRSTPSARARCAPSCAATAGGKLWNEYVARYHYLGYKTLVGAQMRLRRARQRRHAARHARRTRPRIGRSPRTVQPRLAFPPRRTRPPAFARAAPTSTSVTDRQRDTVWWRPCVHRGLRSSRRPDRRTDPVMDVLESRKRPTLKGGRRALHVYRHHHRDSRFWPAARTRTRRRLRTSGGCSTSTPLRFDLVEVSMRWTWGRAAPRRVGCAMT